VHGALQVRWYEGAAHCRAEEQEVAVLLPLNLPTLLQ
jgi:hypothetical protein